MKLALPQDMAQSMKNMIYGDFLGRVPIFRSLGDEVIMHLCNSVQPQLCLTGQYVMQIGDIGTDFFILLKGELKVSEAAPESPNGMRFLGCLLRTTIIHVAHYWSQNQGQIEPPSK
jgi:hypothetical protein